MWQLATLCRACSKVLVLVMTVVLAAVEQDASDLNKRCCDGDRLVTDMVEISPSEGRLADVCQEIACDIHAER